MWVAGLSMQRVARERFGPFVDAPWSFTPPGIRKAKLLDFRPRVVPEIARCTRHSLPFGPSITVPGLAYLFSAFRHWSASIAGGPPSGRGKAERNLSWPSHFCILRRSDRQPEVGRCRQWCVVRTPINSVVPSSMRRAVVNSWCKPTDSVWKSIFDCAAWPLLAAQKASNQ